MVKHTPNSPRNRVYHDGAHFGGIKFIHTAGSCLGPQNTPGFADWRLCTRETLSPPSSPPPLLAAPHATFRLCECDRSRDFMEVESWGVWPSITGLFPRAHCLQASSTLQPVSHVPSLLGLNRIALYVDTTFCASIHLWMDRWWLLPPSSWDQPFREPSPCCRVECALES